MFYQVTHSRSFSSQALKNQQLKDNDDYDNDGNGRRKSLSLEGSKKVGDDFYNKPLEIPVTNHRRKRYDELVSVHDRKKETDMNKYLMRSGI